MNDHIRDLLQSIPDEPGVYLMKDDAGEVIYVGKAKVLKNRVRSYFTAEAPSPKIYVMVPKIADIDFITTDSEMEALVLEDALIKKHQPRYNTLLKDDKKFPWIEITNEDFPRIQLTRSPKKKSSKNRSRYYGPYVDASSLRNVMDFIKQVFPLKQCRAPVCKDRPCINYHIGRCMGLCQGMATAEEYQQVVKQVELFLTGKQESLIDRLKEMMYKASERQEYERAAKYRDTIRAMQKIQETQKVVFDDPAAEQDLFAFAHEKFHLSIVLFRVREGKLVYKEAYDVTMEDLDTPEETLWAFIKDYYTTIGDDQVPRELIVPVVPEEYEGFNEYLSERRGSTVKMTIPKAQRKFELLNMAEKNAKIALDVFIQKAIRDYQNHWNQVGITIQNKLGLDKFPIRLECFDISHLSGVDTVASMVVFEAGRAKKSDYRRFKIRSTEGKSDDFKSMEEVITRRYSRLLKEKEPFPDLIIVDGGKGQLSSALNALARIGVMDQPIVSLAKKFEEVFIPYEKNPVVFEKDSPPLFLFQQIRDEAHRFAVTYQRKLRTKRLVKSSLDNLTSIGEKRRSSLMRHFGTIERLVAADIDDIAKVEGISLKTAEKIFREVHGY